MTDYSDRALFKEALAAYDDPVFAAWLCRGFPWGGVDLQRGHEGYELARDGLAIPRDALNVILSDAVKRLIELEKRAEADPVFAPSARSERELVIGLRRLIRAHPADTEFRLRCPCSVSGEFADHVEPGWHPLPEEAG